MAKVGILGGAFNPPHNGHLALARAAVEQLGLDELLFVPASTPPHKPVQDDPGADARFELCAAAVEAEPRISASRMELDRGGVSFSVDTLRQLREQRGEDELVFILGEDAIRSLAQWREPEAVVELADLAWVARDDQSDEPANTAEIEELAMRLGATKAPTLLAMEPNAVSSTEVRRRISAAEPIDELVPTAVAVAIEQGGLYRSNDLREAAMTEDKTETQPVLTDAELAAEVVRLAHDKKGTQVIEMDLTGLVDYTDRFVIVTARSDRQAKAIHDGILGELKMKYGLMPRRVEGLPEGRWVLIDLYDVVVHIFQQEARDTYRLEKLWGDAPKTEHEDLPPEPDFMTPAE
ncbi:MAG: nicotinate-nucleotide adenylyltransferase [Solirubrobacterales bacterium]|nr:nicotinate-nucleotide adenylyltransferase [Solirubrobacterales bacterium]